MGENRGANGIVKPLPARSPMFVDFTTLVMTVMTVGPV
jgi:hypothetical protein